MHAHILCRILGSLHSILGRSCTRGLGVSAVLFLCGWASVRADLVILKDGFILQGKVKRDTEIIIDGNIPIAVSKLGGFFMVDDGARRIIFPQRQAQDVSDSDRTKESSIEQFERRFKRLDHFRVPAGLYAGFTPWTDKWDRARKLNTGRGTVEIQEHLSILSPIFVRIDARRYNWSPHYLTRELDADSVRDLLYKHPDLKLSGTDKDKDAAKRFRVFHFLVEAGWYEKAVSELDIILKEAPDQKEKVESAREQLKAIVTSQFLDLIERAHKAGRHAWTQEKLSAFPRQGADEKLLVRVRALQSSYETANKNLATARHLLESLLGRMEATSSHAFFGNVVAAILAELNVDSVGRLEAFQGLAQQAEHDREANRTPSYSAEQLLSLAVSGWLLGSAAAESKLETATSLWRTREFILEYQKTADAAVRRHMLAEYEKNRKLPVDELAQLISLLPPPEPFEAVSLTDGPWAAGALPFAPASIYWALFGAQKALPAPPLERQVDIPGNFRKGPRYFLQLPPEYHVGRSYPVLFVLHEAGEKPEEMLKRWSIAAAQNGYFLVAPEWEKTGSSRRGYQYSAQEHAAVLEVLRELRRQFQVDSDKVFVSGLGEGGNMAYDVGLAHPDLFAGVLPMGGRPRYFAKSYWQNGQYLPFYVIDGDMNGDVAKDNRHIFESWIPRGYPSLYVQYKGRGSEWFEAELPTIFDWMSRKKRAFPIPELGRVGGGGPFGEGFQSMRPIDNHFYWLQGQGLGDKQINDSQDWKSSITPGTLQGRIIDANQININAHGFKRAVIWFSQGMIDFDKPLTIRLNSQKLYANQKVALSLDTLLEDFFQRGDRQRLFLAKFEIVP